MKQETIIVSKKHILNMSIINAVTQFYFFFNYFFTFTQCLDIYLIFMSLIFLILYDLSTESLK